MWVPEGWLKKMEAVDFAGGLVVHISAAVSGLVASLIVGERVGQSETGHRGSIAYFEQGGGGCGKRGQRVSNVLLARGQVVRV